jgi:hypothetical protein
LQACQPTSRPLPTLRVVSNYCPVSNYREVRVNDAKNC